MVQWLHLQLGSPLESLSCTNNVLRGPILWAPHLNQVSNLVVLHLTESQLPLVYRTSSCPCGGVNPLSALLTYQNLYNLFMWILFLPVNAAALLFWLSFFPIYLSSPIFLSILRELSTFWYLVFNDDSSSFSVGDWRGLSAYLFLYL
ncbi:hypothetical protein Tco_0946784 [Tanacetum coccineum]